jgi:hypothetical protein
MAAEDERVAADFDARHAEIVRVAASAENGEGATGTSPANGGGRASA